MIGALYVERQSPIHRLQPGWKLLALPIFAAPLFATDAAAAMGAALALVLGCYAVAKIPLRALSAQLRIAAPVLTLLFLVQLWLAGLEPASTTALRFLALILAAALVTMTTRTSDLIAALEAFLSRLSFLGVDAAKVSLAISLVIRFVPVIAGVLDEIREAQAARGSTRSLFSLAVPLVVRTLKMADGIAEAIDARS